MQHLPELLGIATAMIIGAASPGPSFVMVAAYRSKRGAIQWPVGCPWYQAGDFLR
ncbi:hypothetical protein ACO0LC_11180 [Undibacterium sp. JH2W]|uniref:hypothetical protein n=1 Tax=Undibacterium sp. JH2W TaxID=3413037 RepID=UPI003BF16347